MNNKNKEQVVENLTLYRDILQDAYQKEDEYVTDFSAIEKYKAEIEKSEKDIEFLRNKEKISKESILRDIKRYRITTLIHYFLYSVFSLSVLVSIDGALGSYLYNIKPSVAYVNSYIERDFLIVLCFILFSATSLLTNPKMKFELHDLFGEKTIYIMGPRESRLGYITLSVYILISLLFHWSLLDRFFLGFSNVSVLDIILPTISYLTSPISLIAFFLGLAVILLFTSSKMRFGPYEKDYEEIENQTRQKALDAIANAKEQIELLKPQLQKTYDEYQNLTNQDLYIEAINFFPNEGMWKTEDYQQSALRLKHINSVIYFLEKNYVETYSEALRYLEVQHHQEQVKREQDNLRYEAELAREEAKEARREANEARYMADKARLEADNARFRAQQAKAQADQAKFQADQARYFSR
ncbi:MAG: hypothetical protein Q4B95_03490 [Lonepinella koalarum]|nr:hypothetical protein [Lonepinella koalarum]